MPPAPVMRKLRQLANGYGRRRSAAAQMSPEAHGSRLTSKPVVPIACPVAIVGNRGHYAITDVYAVPRWHRRAARLRQDRAFLVLAEPWRRDHGWRDRPRAESLSPTTLTPADAGLRCSEDARAVRDLAGSYPIIRWRDSGAPGGRTSRAWSARSPKARTGGVNQAVTVRCQQFAGHRRPARTTSGRASHIS